MNASESFSRSIDDDQIDLAERELCAFIGAVTELFGLEQVRASAQDWLEEAQLEERIDRPPRSTGRNWRAVSIAASARLASRIDAAQHRRKSLPAAAGSGILLAR